MDYVTEYNTKRLVPRRTLRFVRAKLIALGCSRQVLESFAMIKIHVNTSWKYMDPPCHIICI